MMGVWDGSDISWTTCKQKRKRTDTTGTVPVPWDNRRFWWKISLFPFNRKRGGHDVQVSFQSVARFTVVRQMAPLQSGLNAAMENNVIAAHLVHL